MYFAKEVSESLTYKFAQAANELKAQGREIISLGLGEPDFKTPQYVLDELFLAVNGGYTNYSASQGLHDLRNLIAADITRSKGTFYDSSEIIVTPGIKSAVFFALCTLLEPFDTVVNITPYYVSYPAMIKLAEPTSNIVNVKLNKDFSIDYKAMKQAFALQPKCILINTPHNPTGMVLSQNNIKTIIDMALEAGTYIIADEVYEKLVYQGYKHTSFSEYSIIKDFLILANGYSKSHAMTGWRIGYAAGPKAIISKMNKLQQHINTNTCTFVQKAACSIYQNDPVHILPYVNELQQRVDYFHSEVNRLGYMKGVKPQSGFFYFADISNTGLDSNSFCVKLLGDTGIASTPGIAFGLDWDDYVRFSFAAPMPTLEKAINLMKGFKITN